MEQAVENGAQMSAVHRGFQWVPYLPTVVRNPSILGSQLGSSATVVGRNSSINGVGHVRSVSVPGSCGFTVNKSLWMGSSMQIHIPAMSCCSMVHTVTEWDWSTSVRWRSRGPCHDFKLEQGQVRQSLCSHGQVVQHNIWSSQSWVQCQILQALKPQWSQWRA